MNMHDKNHDRTGVEAMFSLASSGRGHASAGLGNAGGSEIRALSSEMKMLAERYKGRSVKLGEIVSVLHGRGYRLLIVLLCLPFLTPISLPGLSTPIGLAITLIGARLALGQSPWLPRILLEKKFSPHLLPRLLSASSRLVAGFERLTRPRLQFLYRNTVFQCLGGALIALCGLKLLVPMPIPLSNFFPGVAAALLAAGSFEEDGVVFLAGVVMFVASIAFFVFLALGGVSTVEYLYRH